MKLLLLVCFAFAYVQCSLLSLVHDEEWSLFKMQHNKEYKNDQEEFFRKKVYLNNKLNIARHNKLFESGIHSYNLAMNSFGDMLHHEFATTMNGLLRNYRNTTAPGGSAYISSAHASVPSHKDWRKLGAVTPVKDQGHCGSCWSFSTTGSLEGQHFRRTGKLVSLSEQNLVDCSTSYGNHGCNGGLMDQAFQYIKDNGGIDTETGYPYLAEDEPCEFKKSKVGATDTGYVDIPDGDEVKLKEAIANVGPVSVAIDASGETFQFYSSGVYDNKECSQTELDHGVLVVGYGTTDDGKDYWIVKNSWNTQWGDEGYIMMSRNRHNQCGIASSASYPLV